MINIRDGELLDMMPSVLKTPEAVALSHAIRQAYARYLVCEDGAAIFSSRGVSRDNVLDALAVELRVRNYDQSWPTSQKSLVVMSAFGVAMKDGTRWALDRLVSIACDGGGEVREWYEYGGNPGHFRIKIPSSSASHYVEILSMLEAAKRLTARLDSIGVVFTEVMEPKVFQVASSRFSMPLEVSDKPAWALVEGELTDEDENNLTDEDGNILTA